MEKYQIEFIELLLNRNALKFGDFVLPSGHRTPYFFNMGELNSGKDLSLVGRYFAIAIYNSFYKNPSNNIKFSTIFGAAYKGIPLASVTVAQIHELYDINLSFSSNRKEPKDHGERGLIMGSDIKDKNILLLDDIIAEGVTTKKLVSFIKKSQGKVNGLIVALNREDHINTSKKTASQNITEELKIPVYSIITFSNILEYTKTSTEYSDIYQKLLSYKSSDLDIN